VVEPEGRSQEVFEEYLRKRGVDIAFARLAPLKLLVPPFSPPRFALRQHWHRRYHKDARNIWLRAMILALFNEATD